MTPDEKVKPTVIRCPHFFDDCGSRDCPPEWEGVRNCTRVGGQTGWICHGCKDHGPCVIIGRVSQPLKHCGCCAEADWHEFYGTIVMGADE